MADATALIARKYNTMAQPAAAGMPAAITLGQTAGTVVGPTFGKGGLLPDVKLGQSGRVGDFTVTNYGAGMPQIWSGPGGASQSLDEAQRRHLDAQSGLTDTQAGLAPADQASLVTQRAAQNALSLGQANVANTTARLAPSIAGSEIGLRGSESVLNRAQANQLRNLQYADPNAPAPLFGPGSTALDPNAPTLGGYGMIGRVVRPNTGWTFGAP